MNSTIKTAAKFAEELNQSNKNSGTKKEGTQQTNVRLGVYLKESWESQVIHGQCIEVQKDS